MVKERKKKDLLKLREKTHAIKEREREKKYAIK